MSHTRVSSGPITSSQNAEAMILPIRPTRRQASTLLIDLPIGMRLTLSFLICALIAVVVTGAIGIQRSQTLARQADFYQNLLQANTKLTTGAQFLQEMNAEMQNMLIQIQSQPSQESLNDAQTAMNNLMSRYDTLLNGYISQDLLKKHPDQVALLTEAQHENQEHQQETLAASALRTWQLNQNSQKQVLQEIMSGQLADALNLEKLQVEPTNTDALSALRALILFDGRLARSVQNAVGIEEHNQLLMTIVSSIIAFIAILIIGWLISGTIVRRLHSLRQVTQAVEQGHLARRVKVIGRDEIADVSGSVNGMLDTIVGLLEETRSQRDALSNAAGHLFSEMRVVSAGDLRMNAPMTDDPIGMLANAFNFTLGRFRRFVQRMKAASEQLDVIARQEVERADAFLQTVHNARTEVVSISAYPVQKTLAPTPDDQQEQHLQNMTVVTGIRRLRAQLRQLSQDGITRPTQTIFTLLEQLTSTLERLNKTMQGNSMTTAPTRTGDLIPPQRQELRAIGPLLTQMISELQNVQKNTVKGFQELDKEMEQLSAAIRTQNAKGKSEPPTPLREGKQDLSRLGATFAGEVAALAQQITVLAQEIRAGIGTFQLEGSDNSSISSPNLARPISNPLPTLPTTGDISPRSQQLARYHLAHDRERS